MSVSSIPYRLRLADRFYLAAHSGHEQLSARIGLVPLALGCAGALLTELLSAGLVRVWTTVAPRSEALDSLSGPDDFLNRLLLRELDTDPEMELATCVEYLAAQAASKVRCRLQLEDVLEEDLVQQSRWRGGGLHPVWRMRHALQGANPETNLLALLQSPGPILGGTGMLTHSSYVDEAVLAALFQGTGLLSCLDLENIQHRTANQRITSWRERLPAGPRQIVSSVETATAAWAMTPR